MTSGQRRGVCMFCGANKFLVAAGPKRPAHVVAKKPALPASDPASVGEGFEEPRCYCASCANFARRSRLVPPLHKMKRRQAAHPASSDWTEGDCLLRFITQPKRPFSSSKPSNAEGAVPSGSTPCKSST